MRENTVHRHEIEMKTEWQYPKHVTVCTAPAAAMNDRTSDKTIANYAVYGRKTKILDKRQKWKKIELRENGIEQNHNPTKIVRRSGEKKKEDRNGKYSSLLWIYVQRTHFTHADK